MNKKGLSAIITTLLIVLLVLVAVGIVWGVVGNILREGAEEVSLGKFTLKANIISASIDNSSNNVTITVERNPGKGELTGIKFVFSDGVNSEVITRTTTLEELGSETFVLHLADLVVDNLLTISIVPVFKSSTGKELFGNVLSVFDVKEGTSIIYECGDGDCNGGETCSTCENDCGVCVGGVSCEPNTYYIDFLDGDDNNDGACTNTPWKHSPGDDNALGNAASTTLQAGNTVKFKGGIEYTGSVAISQSGSVGNYIIYDGNSDDGWGNGRAIIDGDNLEINGFYATTATDYIKIKNFEFVDIGGYEDGDPILSQDCSVPISSTPAGRGIIFDYGGSYIEIHDSYFHEIGNWLNQPPFVGNAISGSAIKLKNTNNVIINNINATRSNIAVGVYASTTTSNIEIDNLDCYGEMRWCVDIAGNSDNTQFINISVHDSTFHDYHLYDYNSGGWQGCGTDGPHIDGIFFRLDYNYANYFGNKIYNNKFYTDSDVGSWGTAQIYVTEGPTVDIFNNLFLNSKNTNGAIAIGPGPRLGVSPQTVNIYENTFYQNYTAAIQLGGSVTRPLGEINIKNNIFYDAREGSGSNVAIYIQNIEGLPNTLNYNLYRSMNLANEIVRCDNCGGWMTMSELIAAGWELNGLEADPEFVDLSYDIGDYTSLNDFHLQSTSPAINTGTDLGSSYNVDKEGISRPQGSGWDIGAYEYQL